MKIILLFVAVIMLLASAARPQDTVEDRASGCMAWLPVIMIVVFGAALLIHCVMPLIPE